MIDFSKKIPSAVSSRKINPVEIYETLDRKSEAGPLRPAQNRVLKEWYENNKNKKDIIVKLHTGAGKTLIGLLMGLSYINSGEGPVMYVCPNIYLMQQVCADAQKFGVPFCFINDDNVLPGDFLNGDKILITYVQKVFNGLSIFGIGNRSTNVGCIILDDSHACIDSILGACTINIFSEEDNKLYSAIKNLFEDDLKLQGEGTYQDLSQNQYSTIMPIPYWNWHDKSAQITELISMYTEKNNIKFAWAILKDHLNMCQAYISSNKIEISPLSVPIKTFGIFNNASHRILMSATTQEDTFFIKGLGLSAEAVSNPLIDKEYTWSGEKMILIPSLICEETDINEIEKILLTIKHPHFGIAALTPSFKKAEKYTQYGGILPSGSSMYKTVQKFKSEYEDTLIVFANRYDGIDLPDDICRILFIDSLPYYDLLIDKYEEICRPNSEIIKIKTIQKIEQGLGRSVRGEKDYCVIIILGNDLIKYLKSINNTKYFSSQTQRQLEIGFEIINMAKEDNSDNNEMSLLISTVRQCLDRNDGWKAYYSAKMDEPHTFDANRETMYQILEKEQKAFYNYLSGDLSSACVFIQDIIDLCTNNDEKGWYLQLKAKYMYGISKTESNTLQVAAFNKNTELLKPLSGITYNKLSYPVNEQRANCIKKKVMTYANYNEFSLELEDLLSKFSFGISSDVFERTVKELGEILGFASQRPDKDIRKGPDNLWCNESNGYILIECKSEVEATRETIKKSEAGQMEEHCGWFESEYKSIEYNSIMIIPTKKLSSDAYFNHATKVMNKKALKEFKNKIRSFFSEFKKYEFSALTPETISHWIINHNLKFDDIVNLYSVDPVK